MDLLRRIKSDIKWQKQEATMHLYDFNWSTASWKQSLGELLWTSLIGNMCDPGRLHLQNKHAKIFLKEPFSTRTRELLELNRNQLKAVTRLSRTLALERTHKETQNGHKSHLCKVSWKNKILCHMWLWGSGWIKEFIWELTSWNQVTIKGLHYTRYCITYEIQV